MSAPDLKLVIIDYDASNLRSVYKALVALGHSPLISNDPETVASADGIVLPGVGAAGDAMRHLTKLGLVPVLRRYGGEGRPLFGVCVGMQLLFERSEEDGGIACLGLLEGEVRRLPAGLKVPHIGWNSIAFRAEHPILDDIASGSYVYFVHSYYPVPADPAVVLGETEYGVTFASMVARGNLIGVQFHPEKSSSVGLKLYDNFVRIAARQAAGAALGPR